MTTPRNAASVPDEARRRRDTIAAYLAKDAAGSLTGAERLRFHDEFYKLGRLVFEHADTLLRLETETHAT